MHLYAATSPEPTKWSTTSVNSAYTSSTLTACFWQRRLFDMRVLHFFKTYYPNSYGGAEQAIFQLCEALSAIGVETEVLSLSNNPAHGPGSIGSHRTHYAKLDFEIASMGGSFEVIRKFRTLAAEADI